MGTYRLLTWNIRQGGKKEIENTVASLLLHNADIIVLTEFRENHAGDYLQKEMRNNGWEFIVSANPPENENRVLILSKFPLENLESWVAPGKGDTAV